jgi:DNA replication protein DnaD
MNGTIKNWRKQGMQSLEDIEKGTKKFQTKTQKADTQKETSFDVQKAEKDAIENPKDFGSMKNKKRKRTKGA